MILTLITKYGQGIAIAALLMFGVVEWNLHNHALIERGKAEQRIYVADSIIAVLQTQAAVIHTTFIHDTVRFTKDTGSVHMLTETVTKWKHDTIAVVQYVAKAEAAISSCSDLFTSCKARADNLEGQLAQERSKQPALATVAARSCTVSNVVWASLGAVGVGLGIRLAH